jgi:hypothetical protein
VISTFETGELIPYKTAANIALNIAEPVLWDKSDNKELFILPHRSQEE